MLNFPSNPTNGQTYTDDNGVMWRFDSVKWDIEKGTTKQMYSGCKVGLSSDYSATSNSAAVSFSTESFDTDSFFTFVYPTKITIPRNAFYRVNFSVYTAATGATYSISVKKNGTTTLSSVSLSPNQYSNYDEIIELLAQDYLEVYVSEVNSVGALTSNTSFEITKLGYSQGSAISPDGLFSGVRTILTSSYAASSTPTALDWDSTDFNQNANALGDLYWNVGTPSRLTVGTTGFFRLKGGIQVGSENNCTVTIKKNGTTDLTTANVAPNGFAEVDDIHQFTENEYLQLYLSDSNSTGTLTSNTYLELVRVGI